MVFDFDGTIADAEPYHLEAYQRVLINYGVVLSDSVVKKYIGNSEKQIYSMIKRDYSIDFNDEQFFADRISIFRKVLSECGLKPFPYINELLLKYPNYQKAILSSQSFSVINELLSNWCLSESFPIIISATQENKTKEWLIENLRDYIC